MDDDDLSLDYSEEEGILYRADPNCKHELKLKWSGIKCRKCGGWFCY